jgi:hypothetical protein
VIDGFGNLVAQLGQFLVGIVLRSRLLGLGQVSSLSLLSLVVCRTLDFSSLFKSVFETLAINSPRPVSDRPSVVLSME